MGLALLPRAGPRRSLCSLAHLVAAPDRVGGAPMIGWLMFFLLVGFLLAVAIGGRDLEVKP